jgi:hypothetical protein
MRRLGIVRQVCVATIGALLGALLVVGIQATPAFAAVPTVTSISPAFGTWQGGVVMTITGTNFTTIADTTVDFGTIPGTVTAVGATSITVTSPANPSTAAGTSAPITVINSNGTSVPTSTVASVTWVSGSTCLNGTFASGNIGSTITGGTGLPANAVITNVGGSRVDATGVTVTNGSDNVLDTHILASDQGRPVSSTVAGAIPANTFVGTVTAGASFLLSSSPTSQVNVNAGAAATTVTVGCASPNATISAPTTAAQSTGATMTVTLSVTYPNCTFNSQVAGAVLTVVPGASTVPITCSKLQGGASFVMALVSSVAGVVTPFSVSADESLIMNNSPALPPSQSSDPSGNMSINLAVPAKTTGGNPPSTAADPDGTCPPTQFTVNQGLFTCAVAVANLSGVNFGNALLEYPGQLSPQTPTLALSQAGSSATTISATGNGWWGTGPASSDIAASRIRIGCTGTPCTGGVTALTSNLKVSSAAYAITCSTTLCTGNFQPTRLTGTFTIPTGATGTVAIDQPTREPAPCNPATQNCFGGNGPGRTDTATVTSGSATVLDSSIQASDVGDVVSGTGIPAGTFVGTVTAGTSFLLSSSATSQVNVNATASGTSVVIGTSAEATAPGVATATASGTGVATWLGNDPNNAIANSSDSPDPGQWWQPVAAATAPLTYTVSLPAATTISATQESWFQGMAPPTGWTVDTSTTGPTGTFTTQLTVAGNTAKSRTDVFPNGQVTGVNAIRLSGITGFGAPCSGCGWAQIALVKFGWDGHGVVFPQAMSPNTTPWNGGGASPVNPTQFNQPIITTLTGVGVAGTTTYGYKVTALNGNGESLASTEKTITNGNATLSASNFNALFWDPVPGAASYNVYGRTAASETFLANVPASATTCAPDTAPIPPCFSDTGAATPVPGAGPPTAGTLPSNALNNPNNAAFFWQPTSAAAAGASYEVDLGSPTVLDSATPSWFPGFVPPSAYEIDTSTNGSTWTPQFTTTTNTSKSATDVFPAGQVTANYVRVVINAPFPAAGTGFAGVALNQFSWNGVAATPSATPPSSSLNPQGYYPATLPNSATANTTSTWNTNSQNNGLFGGSGGRILSGATTTSGSVTVTGTGFLATDVGRPIGGLGLPPGDWVTTFTSATSINVNAAATSTNTGVVLQVGGNGWWQPAGASGNTGNLVVAYDLGFPRTVNSVTTNWLNSTFCPGHGTCTGFEGVNYSIFTSPNGTQNSWTLCKAVTANAAFTTVDTCTTAATGAQYVEFQITSWNSTTPFSAADGYGPAFNSLSIQ